MGLKVNFNKAIRRLTDAINLAPTNHVLYLNRSTAYASLSCFSVALTDAEKIVELNLDRRRPSARRRPCPSSSRTTALG